MKRSEATTPSRSQIPGRRELIWAMLRASATPLSIAAMAEKLGVHPNTVRFHLDALIEAGRVEQVLGEITGPGRPPIVYRASRAMNRNGPTNYRLLAAMLTGHLAASSHDPAKTATDLGRSWGPSLIDQSTRRGAATRTEALTRVIGALTELGFEPEPPGGGRTR
jgi:predicted ArsR family transcriptional regulator